MFNIIHRASDLLKTEPSTFNEILYEFSVEYTIRKNDLPTIENLLAFSEEVPEDDEVSVRFSDGTSTINVGVTAWIDTYNHFTKDLYESDDITVSISIQKKIHDGIINIYNLSAFSGFLYSRSYTQLFTVFAELFKQCDNRISFRLLDTNGSLRTKYIGISDNELKWKESSKRDGQLKKCEEACVFLDRTKYPLLPQDFAVLDPVEGNGLETIQELFRKQRNIWSYIYLANSAYMVNEKAVLQFNPAGVADEYEFEELAKNEYVPQIYDWVFKDEGCVDKASIARKIINTYCSDKKSVLSIDERIYNSIKSDYQIYQKNHVDQYIDMKNKISEHIVDSAKQMQELSHDVAEGLRNNFVAIIVFIMTVLLTDSFDFSSLSLNTISPVLIAVCAFFTLASVIYLFATICMGNQKWKWLKQSYENLKNNYNGTLDDHDIEDAFQNDAPINTAHAQFVIFRRWIIGLWVVMIIGIGALTGILYTNRMVPTDNDVDVMETIPIETEHDAAFEAPDNK